MLNIIFLALMLLGLTLGVFLFHEILFIALYSAIFLLMMSVCLFFQDIVFKKNPLSLAIADLLLKIVYFLIVFAIGALPEKSIASYIFYAAVVIAAVFEIIAFRFKRQDIFLDKEKHKSFWFYLKSTPAPSRLKKQKGVGDDPQKYDNFKAIYYCRLSLITAIVAAFISSIAASACEDYQSAILRIISLSVILITSIVRTVFSLLAMRCLKLRVGYKIIILLMTFSSSVLSFCSRVYFSEDNVVGVLTYMLALTFYGIAFYIPYLSVFCSGLQLLEIEEKSEKEEKVEKIEEETEEI